MMDTIKIIGIVGYLLIASEVANAEIPDLRNLFADAVSLTRLPPYLEALYVLPSGKRLISRLDELKDCGLKMIINDTELKAGTSFEDTIAVSEISDNKVVMSLPPYAHGCKISIPILCKKGDAFCVQDIQVPAYIAVGHELIHFIHKVEALNSGLAIRDINTWEGHRDNRRAIATLYGYDPKEHGFSDDESDEGEGSAPQTEGKGFMDFCLGIFDSKDKKIRGEDYTKYFEDAWGGTKAYEELRTITGKETNSLVPGMTGSFKFESSDLDLSERHLLSDFFTIIKTILPPSLRMCCKPFITRWTHALKADDVENGSFELVKHLFTDEEIALLPNYVE